MDEPFDLELSLAVNVEPANAAVVSSDKAAAKIVIFFTMVTLLLFGTDHSNAFFCHREDHGGHVAVSLFTSAIFLISSATARRRRQHRRIYVR
jgi:hypothetical protein